MTKLIDKQIIVGLDIGTSKITVVIGECINENEINMLKEQNKELMLSNDSIKSLNLQLEKEIKEILFTIDSTQALLRNTEKKLKKLEERRSEVSNIVDNLNSDGITESLSNYLKRRGQNPR